MIGFKERCVVLRKQDRTLTEIVKITGRPKTSVYAHIHTIPLSARKQNVIRKEQGARIRMFAIARKGKSERAFKKIQLRNPNAVYFLSHFLFDGDIQNGGCSYNNRNAVLLKRVELSLRHIYTFRPTRYSNSLTGVSRISYFNVALRAHVEEMMKKLLEQIIVMPKELKRIFLRSFFDDEGCVDFRQYKNTRRVRGYQKEVKILFLVQKLLRDFDVQSFIVRPNEIVIAHKENLVKFQNEIGFSPGVRINGKRSNSIWKQSLEKREILRRAIASYKPVGSSGVHRKVVSQN